MPAVPCTFVRFALEGATQPFSATRLLANVKVNGEIAGEMRCFTRWSGIDGKSLWL